jgi:hypothetical protein
MSTSKEDLYGQLKAAHDGVKTAEKRAEDLRAPRAEIATQLATAHKVTRVKLDGVAHDLVCRNAMERKTAKDNGEDLPAKIFDVAVPRSSGPILGD